MVITQSQKDYIALVPVREGSKGLPKKNILELGGVPLYRRALDQGLRIVNACAVSTDFESILNSTVPDNCYFLRRPEDLCGDEVPIDEVIAHVVDDLNLPDATTIVLLQATSPFRADEDIRAALDLYAEGKYDLTMSVTQTDQKVLKYGTLDGDSYVPLSNPKYCFANRQSLPLVFKPNGAVYVFTVGVFRRNRGLATESIGVIKMPSSRAIDIDSIDDFELAKRLLEVGI